MSYMRRTVTISLPDDVKAALDRASREAGLSRSDVVRESLRDFLFFREYRQLRERLTRAAKRRGIYSDEDVFRRVS